MFAAGNGSLHMPAVERTLKRQSLRMPIRSPASFFSPAKAKCDAVNRHRTKKYCIHSVLLARSWRFQSLWRKSNVWKRDWQRAAIVNCAIKNAGKERMDNDANTWTLTVTCRRWRRWLSRIACLECRTMDAGFQKGVLSTPRRPGQKMPPGHVRNYHFDIISSEGPTDFHLWVQWVF
jgi:hypothetical protein